MKTRRTTAPAVLIAVTAMLSGACLAADNSRETAVKAAEVARFAAVVAGDSKAVDKSLADDLEYCHSSGLCETKAEYMQMMTSGKRKYVGFTPTVKNVRLIGDVALLSGTAKVSVTTDGKSQEFEIGYTDVYLWKDHRWQMTSWRSTRFPDAPPK